MTNEGVEVIAFPGGAPDEETHRIMAELDDLQTWATLLMIRQVPKSQEAADLIQRTRCFIVGRLYPRAMAARAALNPLPHEEGR